MKTSPVKYAVSLAALLFINWLLWSGHFGNIFLIGLGVASCLASLGLAWRMRIVDEEGAPVQLGLRPQLLYAPWLMVEIVKSNFHVAKIILSSKMPLRRNLIRIPANQESELGKVIYANSITLTPGTVSVRLQGNEILVHGLSLSDADNELNSEMGDRICKLERGRDGG